MSDSGLHDEISRLEGEIEALAESAERCRKIALAAKIAIAVGAAWLAALLFGLIDRDAIALLGSTAAVLGGIVVFGSNATTAGQIAADIAAAERQRAELIGGIDLQLVPGERPLLH